MNEKEVATLEECNKIRSVIIGRYPTMPQEMADWLSEFVIKMRVFDLSNLPELARDINGGALRIGKVNGLNEAGKALKKHAGHLYANGDDVCARKLREWGRQFIKMADAQYKLYAEKYDEKHGKALDKMRELANLQKSLENE